MASSDGRSACPVITRDIVCQEVKVSQQRVCAPATFFFFSFVVSDCLSVWLFAPPLHGSDSVLACLTCCGLLLMSKPMLQTMSTSFCCRCIRCWQQCFPWLVISRNVGALVLNVYPGAGCCFVAFCSRIALAWDVCMLPGLWECLL